MIKKQKKKNLKMIINYYKFNTKKKIIIIKNKKN